ncbi:RNA-binding E3 ubiquitin-protein ligase MEX3C [Ambystoma mexicanum]|uniref:RNA-binding E3 ubiquitin-protein ligase MEX3C n=1 Tax=Ambystoma mexicanum TaxID=8296 RepID=UPI0037E93D71
MPSGAGPPLPEDRGQGLDMEAALLRESLAGLGLEESGSGFSEPSRAPDEGESGEEEEEEEEEDGPVLLLMSGEGLGPPDTPLVYPDGRRGGVAAALAQAYGGEQAALIRSSRRSVNTNEFVPVPTSEHVAEIVGRQGCKIKALRAKTNTYIKTPVRGEEPVFVVTGRKEDVAMAKREILSAAEHFSMIRASRNKNGPALAGSTPSTTNLPGQTTVQVRVPYRVVGLVVGPKGATIKRIQQQTHTYIVTPSRDKEPVFEVTGMPENVDRAREEIEMHIAMRTGNYIELNEENDFHYNGTDVSFEAGSFASAWLSSNATVPVRTRMVSSYRNDSSSSLGSGSTDSFFGSNRLSDFSPTSPFSAGTFWFGETHPSMGSEDLSADSPPSFDSLQAPPQAFWAPFESTNTLTGFGGDAASNVKNQRSESLSPTFPEGIEHSLVMRVRGDLRCANSHAGLPIYIPAFSSGSNGYSSSNGGSSSNSGSTSSSPPESRRKHDCVICFENEVIAALVPCGHNLFCMECAKKICEKEMPLCPVCQASVTQAIQILS